MILQDLKRIADSLEGIEKALCKLANVEVIHRGDIVKEIAIEVSDKSLEELAEIEMQENRDKLNNNRKDNNSFWIEDDMTLEQLEIMQQ